MDIYDLDMYGVDWAMSSDEVAEEAAWLRISQMGWPVTPELLFAMKQLIREQMAGG